MAKFYIREIKFQKKSLSLRDVVTNEMMDYFSKRIAKKEINYEVEYLKEKNVGNYVLFEYDGVKHYIILLNYRGKKGGPKSRGRNSFVQSIPTAYRYFALDNYKNKKIYFYDVNYNPNVEYENFIQLFLKMAMTVGINPIYDVGILPYVSLDEIVEVRNHNKEKSIQNNPTFIEQTDDYLNIYGKVFGANAKDTEMLCIALKEIYSGKIMLYQIKDNKSTRLSKDFIKFITTGGDFEVKDDSYSFTDLISLIPEDDKAVNLRNPRFIYNLFEAHGYKKCALCSCEIDRLIDGAHIFPIEAIKELNVDDETKLRLATNADNGVWLCKNHHKLFDSHMVKITNLGFEVLNVEGEHNLDFINKSIDSLKMEQIRNINIEMFNKRYEFYSI